jgi:hypothetical protein
MTRELKTVREFANKILKKKPAKDYMLHQLSVDACLKQTKFQDGFKFKYKRTVTD